MVLFGPDSAGKQSGPERLNSPVVGADQRFLAAVPTPGGRQCGLYRRLDGPIHDHGLHGEQSPNDSRSTLAHSARLRRAG